MQEEEGPTVEPHEFLVSPILRISELLLVGLKFGRTHTHTPPLHILTVLQQFCLVQEIYGWR